MTAGRVVVIGAGAIGLSVATELARRGATVSVVEQNTPGSGTSATTYGWVNSNNKQPASYHELNLAGLEAHHRLARTTGGDWLVPGGHVEFATEAEHRGELRARVARLHDLGYPAEYISRERAGELVPGLIVPVDADPVVFYPREAHCFPQLYIAFLLRRAAELGVRIITRTRVEGFAGDAQRPDVRLDNGSLVAADRIVSCVGRWTASLARQTGVTVPMVDYARPGDSTVGYLAITDPLPVSLGRLVTTSRLNVRPDGAGRLLLQALDLDVTADPSTVPPLDSPLVRDLIARLQAVLAHTESASVARLLVGRRAMPADGRTIAGPLPAAPWLYVVATHSGITLAPLLGECVAGEILGTSHDLLDDFRPGRFLEGDTEPAPVPARRPGQQ